MLPRVKVALEKALPRTVPSLNRRCIGVTSRRAGSGRLQHFSADSAELLPVVQESNQALSSTWTSSGDNHVSLLSGEPDTGRVFLRALISRLSPRDLNRVARVIGKSGSVKRTGRILEFSRRFHFAVGGDPVLLSLLEQYLKGSTVQVNSALAKVDSAQQQLDPGSLSSLEERLLRLREEAPSFLGSYTKAPLHLVLSPRVFEVLTQVPGPDDKTTSAASKTHDDSLAFIIKAADEANTLTVPLSDEDFGAEKRSDLSLAARVIAARLLQTLPSATLEAFLNLLDEAEARMKSRGERYESHSKYFNAMTQCLGHHWKGLGPDLCRFLRVYDAAAAAVCPFQASAEEHTAQFEEKLLLPLAAMRSKYVTTFVKDAGDPSADMRHLRSSMNNVFIESLFGSPDNANLSAIEKSNNGAAGQDSLVSLPLPHDDDKEASSTDVELLALEDVAEKRQMVHQELLEADASVEVPQTSEKSPMYTSIARTILVAMRATAEPYAIAAIAGENERDAAAARTPVLEAWDELMRARSRRNAEATNAAPNVEKDTDTEEGLEAEVAAEDDRIGVDVSAFGRDAGLWATECTVLIQGLPQDITNHELQRALYRCGNVAGLWVYNRDEKVNELLLGSNLAEDTKAESSKGGNTDESDSGSEGARSDCDDDDDSMGWVEDSAWPERSITVSTEALQTHARRGDVASAETTAGSESGPDDAQPLHTAEVAVASQKSEGRAPLVSAEEAKGLSRKEYNALTAQRRLEAKQARKEAREKVIEDRKAAKLARAEARALAKRAREEAKEAAKVAKAVAKSKPGRKKGVKSVIAAKTLLGRRKSDCYAFVEFTDPRGAQRATAQTMRTFGVCLESQSCRAGEMCRTMPALDLKSVFIYTPKDESVTSVEVEHWVNEVLSPHFSARILRGRTALLHEVTPSICRIDFPSHETAAWAYRQLEDKPLSRGDHLPSVTFRMQWMKVSDSLQKAEKATQGVLLEK